MNEQSTSPGHEKERPSCNVNQAFNLCVGVVAVAIAIVTYLLLG